MSGWKLLPIDITNPAFVVSGAPIDITAEQKTAWDALNLTPLTGIMILIFSISFTVSIDASNDNPNLGLKEGSYY